MNNTKRQGRQTITQMLDEELPFIRPMNCDRENVSDINEFKAEVSIRITDIISAVESLDEFIRTNSR